MNASPGARVLLCGAVAGLVWFLLSGLLLVLFAPGLLAIVERGGPHPRWGSAAFFAIDVGMGILAVWLYSIVAPRHGAGPKAVAITALAWWSIKTLQSAKWIGLGLVPRDVFLAPLATTLVATLGATALGAWLYERSAPSGA